MGLWDCPKKWPNMFFSPKNSPQHNEVATNPILLGLKECLASVTVCENNQILCVHIFSSFKEDGLTHNAGVSLSVYYLRATFFTFVKCKWVGVECDC